MDRCLETESSTWAQTDCQIRRKRLGRLWAELCGVLTSMSHGNSCRQDTHGGSVCLEQQQQMPTLSLIPSHTRYRGGRRIRPPFLGTFKVPLRPHTLGVRVCVSTDGSAPAYMAPPGEGQGSRNCNRANVTCGTVVDNYEMRLQTHACPQ